MYAVELIRKRMEPFHMGGGHEGRSLPAFLVQVLFLLVSLFGAVFCMTCLYLAMRGVMRLGGMVASGGPYAIAHPAPGWTWVFPVSILAGLIFVGLNHSASSRAGGLDILVLAWPALFLSLGWNFLEFGIKGVDGGGLVWGWIICAVAFIPMGGIPLIFVIGNAIKTLRGESKGAWGTPWTRGASSPNLKSRVELSQALRAILVVLQLGAMGLGVFGGAGFMGRLMGTKEAPAAAAEGGTNAGSAFPAPLVEQKKARQELSSFSEPVRIAITFSHNTLEIESEGDRLFYNGRGYRAPRDLPSEARQVLTRISDYLATLSSR